MAALSNSLRNPTGTAASRVSTAASSIREAIREFTASSAASRAARTVKNRVSTVASRAVSTVASRAVSTAASRAVSTSANRAASTSASRAASTSASRAVSTAASRAVSTAASRAVSTAASRAVSTAPSDNLDKTDRSRKRLNNMKPLPPQKLQKDDVRAKRALLKHLPLTIYNPIVDWEEISYILNIPFKAIPEDIMRSLLLNSFTGNYEEDLKILHDRVKEYKSIYKEYYKYIQEIQTHLDKYSEDIDLILNILFENEDKEREDFITELKRLMSSYDPFNIGSDKLNILLNFLCREKCVKLYDKIIFYEFNNIIVESSDKVVQRNTLKKKLYEKRYLFRTIQFIIMIINNWFKQFLKRDITSNINLINILVHEEGSKILDSANTDDYKDETTGDYLLHTNSISVNDDSLVHASDTSVSSSSSYNKKRQKAKAEEKAAKEKERYIRYLLDIDGGNKCDNEIADEDSITLKNVRDLSMSKLRNIIRISHQVNGKKYCYLFDARALYNDWKKQYSKQQGSNQQYKHPITREIFTDEQLNDIFFAVRKRDFRIKDNAEKANAPNARHDIEYIFSKQNDPDYYIITLSYTINVNFKDGKVGLIVDKIDKSDKNDKQSEYRILLIKIKISKKILLSEKYSVENLSDKIYKMYNSNQILGKRMPFKIHPAFDKYNMQKIIDFDKYKDFFNMVFKQI